MFCSFDRQHDSDVKYQSWQTSPKFQYKYRQHKIRTVQLSVSIQNAFQVFLCFVFGECGYLPQSIYSLPHASVSINLNR